MNIAVIGGFAVVFEGARSGRDALSYSTLIQRTGVADEIDLPVTVTPLGAVARLEHALVGFEDERERFRARQADAERRLASYRGRQAAEFGFAGELAEKRRQLAKVEASLSRDVDTPLGYYIVRAQSPAVLGVSAERRSLRLASASRLRAGVRLLPAP